MRTPRRLLPAIAAALSLAALLFGLCVVRARSAFGPVAPAGMSTSASGRDGAAMMEGMETSPPPSPVVRRTSQRVWAVLGSEPDLARMRALLRVAGVAAALEHTRAVTVFAPSAEAFDRMRAPTYVQLLEPRNLRRMVATVRYHVVPGSFSPERLRSVRELETLDGARLRVKWRGGAMTVGDAGAVVTERVQAADGWVYRSDAVLEPVAR